MNEFNINGFSNDENEIERIQKEISRDLSPEEPAADGQAQTGYVYPADSPKALVPAPEETRHSAAGGSYYKETVKNEKHKNTKGQMKRTVIAACIVALLGGPLAGLFIGVGSFAAGKYLGSDESEAPASFSFTGGEINTISVAPNPSSIIDDFSAIVDLIEPSVVGITSVQSSRTESFFFPESREDLPSQGSGIIFDQDGKNVYILTNYHVVGGASTVGVSVQGADIVSASLVGAESNSDIAVISILKSDLETVGVASVKVAKFGDSDDMKVGEIVLAIGNALGEGNTATLGILSAKDKEINVEGLKLNVMQTDAAINPGNSGGPLVNSKGEVIAMNTAKFQYYDVEGTGYSIAIDNAKPIIEELRNKKPKPFIGIGMAEIDEETAALYNLPSFGVLVTSVIAGAGAEKAGILKNDIITGFNGKPILSIENLTDAVAGCKVGDTAEIKLYRLDEGAVTVKVTVGQRPVQDSF